MKPIICNCVQCRCHRSTRSAMVRAKRKAARQQVRCMLRRGQWESLPVAFVVGYTDWPLYQRVVNA